MYVLNTVPDFGFPLSHEVAPRNVFGPVFDMPHTRRIGGKILFSILEDAYSDYNTDPPCSPHPPPSVNMFKSPGR